MYFSGEDRTRKIGLSGVVSFFEGEPGTEYLNRVSQSFGGLTQGEPGTKTRSEGKEGGERGRIIA